jgi:hypothetical protein
VQDKFIGHSHAFSYSQSLSSADIAEDLKVRYKREALPRHHWADKTHFLDAFATDNISFFLSDESSK